MVCCRAWRGENSFFGLLLTSASLAQAPQSLQSLNPDISFIADVAAAGFSADDPMQDGGHDPNRNGFNLLGLELAVSKAVDPYFRFDAFIVFAEDEVEVEEVYATTLALPFSLQMRAGQFLTRFGRFNATHPHSWDFVDQPFALSRVFGGEGNRGLGVELSWLTPLPWYVEIVGSSTNATGEETARSFYGAENRSVGSPLDFQSTLALKQFFPLSQNWSLLWGLSTANGPNSTGPDNRTNVYGTDLYLQWRPITYASAQQVTLHTEWLLRRRQVPDDLLQDVSGFAQTAWRFARRWETGARWEYGTPTYDIEGNVTVNDLEPEWTKERQRAAVQLTFWPTEFSRLRAQVSSDIVGFRDEPVWAAFLAFEFSVGAHGAHAF